MPVYVKKTFWANMSTIGRSESINAFFDKYVHSKTMLKQFVEQYENAHKWEKESQANYESFNSTIPCVFDYNIEKQF